MSTRADRLRKPQSLYSLQDIREMLGQTSLMNVRRVIRYVALRGLDPKDHVFVIPRTNREGTRWVTRDTIHYSPEVFASVFLYFRKAPHDHSRRD